MAEEEAEHPKWEGKATAELRNSSPNQIWPLISDFCSLHKWFPSIDTCYSVQGEAGQPGQIRYCASTTQPPSDGHESQVTTQWVKERLLSIDPKDKCFSYEVLDNNVGFKSYVGTIKLMEEMDGSGGCRIEWSFVADPVEGWTFEGLCSYIDTTIKVAAERMEAASSSM